MRRKKRHAVRFSQVRLLIFLVIGAAATALFLISIRSWNGQARFSVAVRLEDNSEAGKLALFSLEPGEERGSYIYVHPQVMMDIPYGYKTYPAYSIYKLGELDRERGGGKLLKKSIETTFGIKTDRYLRLTSAETGSLPENPEDYGSFRKKNFTFASGLPFLKRLIFNAGSDMTPVEKVRFFMALRKIRPSDMFILNLSETRAVELTKLPDGSGVYSLDLAVFDEVIDSKFQDIEVRSENFSVEVQNASSQSKIASQFSRIMENIGAHVVFLTTGDKVQNEECRLLIYKDDAIASKIAVILQRDYNCRIAEDAGEPHQTDIKVIIGEGFLK